MSVVSGMSGLTLRANVMRAAIVTEGHVAIFKEREKKSINSE